MIVATFAPGIETLALFVVYGVFVGVLFGCVGMGGSFLVTPVLIVSGYPIRVAVGSGLAFVFGTSVIGVLGHRDHGQVDYKLAALLLPGATLGIEVGGRAVFLLDDVGSAGIVVSVAYVILLASTGVITLRDARRDDSAPGGSPRAGLTRLRRLPPAVTLAGNRVVSAWVVLGIGGVIGVLSGFLGVGGGFLLLPAMLYGLGVPAAVAVGTAFVQITVSSAYGAYVFAAAEAIALPAVGSLLVGSVFGVRIGAGAAKFVDEDGVRGYLSALLIAGSLSVAMKALSDHIGLEVLGTVSVALVVGTPVLVGTSVVLAAVREFRRANAHDAYTV